VLLHVLVGENFLCVIAHARGREFPHRCFWGRQLLHVRVGNSLPHAHGLTMCVIGCVCGREFPHRISSRKTCDVCVVCVCVCVGGWKTERKRESERRTVVHTISFRNVCVVHVIGCVGERGKERARERMGDEL